MSLRKTPSCADERGPTLWSEKWPSYSSFDGILLTGDTLAGMNPAARTALWQYVEGGGSLVVQGGGEGAEELAAAAPPERRLYPLPSRLWPVCRCRSAHACPVEATRLAGGHALLAGNGCSLVDQLRTPGGEPALPVLADPSTSVGGLFVLVLGLTVVIGPVNLLLLARGKRCRGCSGRRRCCRLPRVQPPSVTCPSSKGGRESSHEAITFLDQNTERAATIGWTAFCPPLTPADGLRFSPATELALQTGEHKILRHRLCRASRFCTLDWSDGQHLARDRVSARLPTHFRLRKNEIRRERLRVRRDKDGNLSAENGLGAEVRKVWVADEQGRLYAGGPLGLSAERLHPAARGPQGKGSGYAAGRLPRGLARPRPAHAHPPGTLSLPRSYLADVAVAPFVEDGLPDARRARRSAVVLASSRRSNRESRGPRIEEALWPHPGGEWHLLLVLLGADFRLRRPQRRRKAPPCASWPPSTSRPPATPSSTASPSIEEPEKAHRLVGYVPDALPDASRHLGP